MSITYTIFDDSAEEPIEIRVQMSRDEIESLEKAHYEMVNGDIDYTDDEIADISFIMISNNFVRSFLKKLG